MIFQGEFALLKDDVDAKRRPAALKRLECYVGKAPGCTPLVDLAKAQTQARIGEKLLRRLASDVRRQGGVYIELVVDTENFAAQRFYERAGIVHHVDDQVHRISGEAFAAFADADDAGPA